MDFLDQWLWVFFISVGLFLVLLELLLGVDTGLDLVAVGTALFIGGISTAFFESWIATAAVTSGICLLYLTLGRRYIHQNPEVGDESKTNVDAIIGREGIVLITIARDTPGLVKVGNEDWRASANEECTVGEHIIVTGVSGVTLSVTKANGGE
ncbi:MAG: NfeD family protein [Chloroflexota bacterium]|nr:NfeD family protein [Chloroflexota bacterium]